MRSIRELERHTNNLSIEIRSEIDDLCYDFYDEHDTCLVFHWNCYDTLRRISRDINDFNRNIKRIIELKSMAEEDDEWQRLDYLQDIYNEYSYYMDALINKRLKQTQLRFELNKINFMINQFERFDGFKENQNNFDNYISLLKIIQRCQSTYGIKINFQPKFNSKTFDVNKLEKEFKKKFINEQFNNMVLKFNIQEVL